MIAVDRGTACRISGRLFLAVNDGREGFVPPAYEALRMCCGWLVPNTFAVSSSEDTELSGVGKYWEGDVGESVCVTVGMKVVTGLRFSRGGRSALGLFIPRPGAGTKDIRSDASMTLYLEVSESTESTEIVLEWVVGSNEGSLSSAVRKETDDCTMGELNPGDTHQFRDQQEEE